MMKFIALICVFFFLLTCGGEAPTADSSFRLLKLQSISFIRMLGVPRKWSAGGSHPPLQLVIVSIVIRLVRSDDL